jgi:hypothetical protein
MKPEQGFPSSTLEFQSHATNNINASQNLDAEKSIINNKYESKHDFTHTLATGHRFLGSRVT